MNKKKHGLPDPFISKRLCSGHKDKNGEKIYYGDNVLSDSGHKFIVEFRSGRIYFSRIGRYGKSWGLFPRPDEIIEVEIIK